MVGRSRPARGLDRSRAPGSPRARGYSRCAASVISAALSRREIGQPALALAAAASKAARSAPGAFTAYQSKLDAMKWWLYADAAKTQKGSMKRMA